MNRPPLNINWEIPLSEWTIPLRYYRGWTIEFSIKTEKFSCPLLCLFDFNCTADLEKAIDRAIQYREKGN